MNITRLLLPSRDYYPWLLRFFKIFGLYKPEATKFKTIYKFLIVPHFTLLTMSVVLGFLNVLFKQETFQRVMLNIGVLSLHIAAGLRILSWFLSKDEFETIIRDVIQRPSFRFDVFGYDGNPKKITKKRTSIDAFRNYTLHRTNFICSALYLIVFVYIALNFVITYAGNYFQEDVREGFNPTLNRTSLYRDFPYPMWFPFDVSISDGYYYLAFLYQPYAYYTIITSFWCVDWLVLSSVIHLQSQLTVLSFALTKVDKNIVVSSHDEKIFIKKMRLAKCVHELSEICRAAALMDDLCNKQLLVQNGLATFILCTLLYVTTTLTVATEISYIASTAGIVLLEPLTQCWICQNFTLEFSKVSEKVYELDWIHYPPVLRRYLVLTMMRLQKPSALTLGKWINIDIAFYIQLLRMTYSFYTLISR